MKMQANMRIAIVGSVLTRFDAIANDIVRTARYLQETSGWEVAIFAAHNEFTEINVHVVPRVSDLLRSQAYLNADLIIYHFGIYYPLFDAIIVGNGRAKQAVVFHNITPIEYVEASSRLTIEKSFAQLANLKYADEIWADSQENCRMLLNSGFEAGKILIQPLAVERPPLMRVLKSADDSINILFVGRIVRAKGVHELIKAFGKLIKSRSTNIRLKIVGNLTAADTTYRTLLLELVASLNLGRYIDFLGEVSEETKDELYIKSHILAVPSYHEGFGVPVIEGLRSGLIPVLYSAYNLKYIADGLCISCPPGDIEGLTAALERAISGIELLRRSPGDGRIRLDRGELNAQELQSSIDAHLLHFAPTTVSRKLKSLVENLSSDRANESKVVAIEQ